MTGHAWMPFYVGDYLADTMNLSRDQHGAYLLLIFGYWQRGGPLPDDNSQLAEIAKTPLSQWPRYRKVLAPFFQIKQGHHWRHKRIDAELEKWHNYRSAKSKAGSKGAAKRWQTDRQTDSPRARPPPPPSPEEPPPLSPPKGGGRGRTRDSAVTKFLRGALNAADEYQSSAGNSRHDHPPVVALRDR